MCWVPQSLHIFGGRPPVPPCLSAPSAACMTHHMYYNVVVHLDLPGVTGCGYPCRETEYQVVPRRDASILGRDNIACLFVYYKTTTLKIFDEYLLYDTNAIISAIGGSLGLFLGFSCFQAVRRSLRVHSACRWYAGNSSNNNKKKEESGVDGIKNTYDV